MPLLSAQEIYKTYPGPKPLPILKGLSFTLLKGESVAIMGRSGEGKSTLLQILGTLDQPDSGTLSILGNEVTKRSLNELRSQAIGFLFQSFHLLEDFSLLDNVLMPATIARRSRKEAMPRAMHLIERVGLRGREKQMVKTLSGGERQRVALARALCNDPAILFADEPTGNLDYQTACQVQDLLLSLTKDEQKSLVLVTHNEDLAALCDRRLLLREGLLVS